MLCDIASICFIFCLTFGWQQSGTFLYAKKYSVGDEKNFTMIGAQNYSEQSNSTNTTIGQRSGIIRGSNVSLGELPWMVKIEPVKRFHEPHQKSIKPANPDECSGLSAGGSLIQRNMVLTGARTFFSPNLPQKQICYNASVYAGFIDQEDKRNADIAKYLIFHPDFKVKDKAFENDIAIVVITIPFELSTNIKLINLPSPTAEISGFFLMAGWGYIKDDKPPESRWLQKVHIEVQDKEWCSGFFEYHQNISVPNNTLCAGNWKFRREPCTGDQGGPLMKVHSRTNPEGTILGVYSFGHNCHQDIGYLGIYEDVRKYLPFIKKMMKCFQTIENQNASKKNLNVGNHNLSKSLVDNPMSLANVKNVTGGTKSTVNSSSSANSTQNRRIVGGHIAEEGEVPWIVKIKTIPNRGNAGGTLILPNVVLTCAHVFFKNISPTQTDTNAYAEAGLTSVPHPGIHYQKLKGKKLIIHPNYISIPNPFQMEYDVAILIMEKDFEESDHVKVAQVFYGPWSTIHGNVIKIAGWGSTNASSPRTVSDTLRVAEVIKLDQKQCNKMHEPMNHTLHDTTFCAAGSGIGPCGGDSGGPAYRVMSNKSAIVVGIMSYGNGCANPNYPMVYTDVSKVTEFIQDELECEELKQKLRMITMPP